MANLVVAETDVGLITPGIATKAKWGATVKLGHAVYQDGDSYKLSNCGAVATAKCDGIAISGGVSGTYGYVMGLDDEEIELGAILTKQTDYCVSDTDGLVMPVSDLTSTQILVRIGTAKTTNILLLNIHETGIAKP